MEEEKKEKKYEYQEEEITTIKLDFDQLEEWRNQDLDDLPICGFLSLYKACGLMPYIEEYVNSKEHGPIVAADNLTCNFYTLQRLKNFITNNWQVYSLDIKEDNNVIWDTRKWPKGQKHYAKKLRSTIRNSINTDFLNFCPGIDDELSDNIIVFKIYHKIEQSDDTTESVSEVNDKIQI